MSKYRLSNVSYLVGFIDFGRGRGSGPPIGGGGFYKNNFAMDHNNNDYDDGGDKRSYGSTDGRGVRGVVLVLV